MEIGSSSAIAACGIARLGLRTAFVGVVGDDVFGRFMLDALDAVGIDMSGCRIDPTVPTGATVILTRAADRANLTAIGAIDRLRGDDVPRELLAAARHLHVGSTYLQPALAADLPELFAEARALDVSTSFDCNWDLDRDLGRSDRPDAAGRRSVPAEPRGGAPDHRPDRRAGRRQRAHPTGDRRASAGPDVHAGGRSTAPAGAVAMRGAWEFEVAEAAVAAGRGGRHHRRG